VHDARVLTLCPTQLVRPRKTAPVGVRMQVGVTLPLVVDRPTDLCCAAQEGVE
jgi:hypothetical protein